MAHNNHFIMPLCESGEEIEQRGGRLTSDDATYLTAKYARWPLAAVNAEAEHTTREPNESFRHAGGQGAKRTNGIRRPAARKSASDPSTDMPSTHGNATAAIRGRRAA